MPFNDIIRRGLHPLGSVFTSNRILLYSVFSTFAVLGAVINACRSHSNFYSVSIYLSRSSRSVLVCILIQHHVPWVLTRSPRF